MLSVKNSGNKIFGQKKIAEKIEKWRGKKLLQHLKKRKINLKVIKKGVKIPFSKNCSQNRGKKILKNSTTKTQKLTGKFN